MYAFARAQCPRIHPIADENAVLREQLDYLIKHTSENGTCYCQLCGRYRAIKLMLLAIFNDAA